MLGSMRSLFAAALLLLSADALSQKSRDASIGVWPWLVGNVDRYQDEIIKEAKNAGLDTIYLHAWRTTGSKQGELRIADEAQTWKTAWGKVLPNIQARSFIAKAHQAGLQVVAVVQVFRSPSPLPNDRGHQDHLIQRVIRYLVHSYDPRGQRLYEWDGIALDYIRWFGGRHDPSQVNRFIDALRKEVGPLPIHAYVIAGAYSIDGGSYDNRFRSYAQFRSYLSQNYGQDWEAMARRIDVLMPMAYTANGHVYGNKLQLMEGYLNAVARYGRQAISNARSSCRLVPAIRTWNSSGQTTTPQTIEACARGAMRGGADGFMAFRYFTARGKPTWFKALGNWTVPGPDLPIAKLSGSANGLDATLDTRGSKSARDATSRLRTRFDLGGDGKFETAAIPVGTSRWILPGPGRRIVGVEVRDTLGKTGVDFVEIGVLPILTASAPTLSAANGGQVLMSLNPGPRLNGGFYFVLSTLSGTQPGQSFGNGVVLPINIDLFTILSGRSHQPWTVSGLLRAPRLFRHGPRRASSYAERA